MGQSPPSSTYNNEGVGLPFFQGKADFGDRHPNMRVWCSVPKKRAQKGDVLISVRAPVGPTNLAPADSCIGRGLAAIRGEDAVLTDFIWWHLRFIEPRFSRRGQGSTFAAIGKDDLRQLPIPIPGRSEQHRIVEILDQADAIRKKRAEADKLMERVLPALFYQMFGDPATNPKGWPTMSLQGGATVRYGLGQPPASSEGGLPLIRATNVSRGTIVADGVIHVAREAVPAGRDAFLAADDIIVVRSGAYTGDIAQVTEEWEGSVAGYDLVIRPGGRLTAEFLESYLLTSCIQRGYFAGQKSRAGQPHLNETQVSETPLFVPPMPLQLKYASAVAAIRQLRSMAVVAQRSAGTLNATLLHRAFTGELTARWREKNKALVEKEMAEQKRILEAVNCDEG